MRFVPAFLENSSRSQDLITKARSWNQVRFCKACICSISITRAEQRTSGRQNEVKNSFCCFGCAELLCCSCPASSWADNEHEKLHQTGVQETCCSPECALCACAVLPCKLYWQPRTMLKYKLLHNQNCSIHSCACSYMVWNTLKTHMRNTAWSLFFVCFCVL